MFSWRQHRERERTKTRFYPQDLFTFCVWFMSIAALLLTWMEKITGLDDDWLRRHLLIAHHLVSDSRDSIYREFDRFPSSVYTAAQFVQPTLMSAYCFSSRVCRSEWRCCNVHNEHFSSCWCLANVVIYALVLQREVLSWFTSSLLWQYFCMKTVLNAVFIWIFYSHGKYFL